MSIVPKDIATYLRQFAPLLEDRILKQFPPLHEPGTPLPPELTRLRRIPYPAQSLAIAGIARRWDLERRRMSWHCCSMVAVSILAAASSGSPPCTNRQALPFLQNPRA